MNCLVNTDFNFYHYKSFDANQQQFMAEVPELSQEEIAHSFRQKLLNPSQAWADK